MATRRLLFCLPFQGAGVLIPIAPLTSTSFRSIPLRIAPVAASMVAMLLPVIPTLPVLGNDPPMHERRRVVEVDFGGNIETTEKILAKFSTVAIYASRGNPNPKINVRFYTSNNITIYGMQLPLTPMPLQRKAQALTEFRSTPP